MVAAGRASQELGGEDRRAAGRRARPTPGLKTFADGEVYCRYEDSIRGADLFIVQSICGSEHEGLTVNDALMELLLMVARRHARLRAPRSSPSPRGTATRARTRSPRRASRSPRGSWPSMLETAGIDRLLTMDLHAGQMQGFFSKPVDHMTAMPILTQYVQDQLGGEELVIISPDAGRVKLSRKFAQKVGAPYALLEKERPAQQVAEIGYVIGDVKDKTAVIVDDIIDTGGTLSAAAQTVLDEGANEVYAVATHGLFSGKAFETLAALPLAGIVVTDTVPLREGAPDLITQLTCADILDRLGPPHLHRRLGVRDLRGREPAVLASAALSGSRATPRRMGENADAERTRGHECSSRSPDAGFDSNAPQLCERDGLGGCLPCARRGLLRRGLRAPR